MYVNCLLLFLYADNRLLFTPFTVTFANPFKIRFANGICSHLNHFLTYFAVNAKYCVNNNDNRMDFGK